MSQSDRDFSMSCTERRKGAPPKRLGRPIVPHPAGSFRDRCHLAAQMRKDGESLDAIMAKVSARSKQATMTMISRGKKYDHYASLHAKRLANARESNLASGRTAHGKRRAESLDFWPQYDHIILEMTAKNAPASEIASAISKVSNRVVTTNAVIGRRYRLRDWNAEVGALCDLMAKQETKDSTDD